LKKQKPLKNCSRPSEYSPSSGFNLTFGIYLDGADWSDKPASLGEVKLGLLGMLNLLETHLGLTAPTVHPARRINQYMNRLQACDRPDAWFHQSFGADAWSTAKKLLEWRDILIESGWNGKSDKSCSIRLQALAKLEQAGLPLEMGREDRLQEVFHNIGQLKRSTIGHVYLMEVPELLPPVWQNIFSKLRDMGVQIDPFPAQCSKPVPSNLSSVRGAMTGSSGKGTVSGKDDSLLFLKASDEWEAAETLAIWLSSTPDSNKDVTIICGADTDVLDQALQRHGLPQLGTSESSRWRSSLQILPLVLANAWKPADVHSLVELLSLSMSPVPKYAVGPLLRALTEEPGTGGGAWTEALKTISEKKEEYLLKDGIPEATAKTDAASFIADLDAFLSTERFDPVTGIPADALKRRCEWVKDFLSRQVGKEPMLVEALGNAKEMQKLAEGKGNVPRVAVERMLDSVIGTGCTSPDRIEQAAPWRVVGHPGQITSNSKVIVWWGFNYPTDSQSVFWNESERDSLKRLGADIENSATLRRREASAWRRAIDNAEETLLMFHPEKMQGAENPHHPFWDEICNAAIRIQPGGEEEEVISCLVRECGKLNKKERWQLADRKLSLQKAEKKTSKKAKPVHKIPENAVSPPKSLSFSQMSTMIGCPMKWTLQYHADLKISDSLSLPTGNTMIGTFCHRIVQELFRKPPASLTAASAEKEAAALFDKLLPSMASELLLDGKGLDCQRYRIEISRAVSQLVAAISKHGLIVDGTEEKLDGKLDGIPFRGYADLILHDKDKNLFVLDLKWSGSSKRKVEEVKEGDSLQLATYAWLLKSMKPSAKINTGYFMLAQGELLSDSELLKEDAMASALSLEQIWGMGVKSWKHHFKAVNDGTLEVTGVKEESLKTEKNLSCGKITEMLKSNCELDGMLYQQPPCFFCDFGNLCGMKTGEE
jgi:hypothetical protein